MKRVPFQLVQALSIIAAMFLTTVSTVCAQTRTVADAVPGVKISEHLNQSVPFDAVFRDHTGKMVRLGDMFDGDRPVLLNLAYHSCPVLCSMVIHATVEGLRGLEWSVGNQFSVITLSIDPRDNPSSAAEKRESVLERYGRGSAAKGWHFLTGDKHNIDRVARAVGFGYHYDEKQGQYAHPAAIMLLTPAGKVARYLYGLRFDSKDLRFGLLEASEGRSVTTRERFLLYCYHYEPGKGYVLMATRLMQWGGIITVLLLFGYMWYQWRKESHKKRSHGWLAAHDPNARNSL
ncbi:MAG: SCO family protein [Myxococcales bacterium]|nr:SCO family protein [Myxococcales bacterium]